MRKVLEAILKWNKKLFPLFVLILLGLVILKTIKSDISSGLLNLDYKLAFVLVSGILVLLHQYYFKNR